MPWWRCSHAAATVGARFWVWTQWSHRSDEALEVAYIRSQAAGGFDGGPRVSDQLPRSAPSTPGDHQKAHDMTRNTYKMSFGGCVWGALVLVAGIALVALAFLYGVALLFK